MHLPSRISFLPIWFFSMRYLIVTDVHGNRFGLEKVLEDAAQKYDKVLCLGDVVGYGAHPNQCCEILRERDTICLLGNHDAAAIKQLDISWFNPVAEAAILWTRQQLSAENHNWLASLSAQRDFAEEDFQGVHGSLREPLEEYITGADIAEPNLLLMARSLCFFGHTHEAIVYRAPSKTNDWTRPDQMQGALLTQGGTLDIEAGWKYLLNPGSCGQPRDGSPQARYAIFDSQKREVEVVALDYDWNAARAAIIEAGLPKVLGDRLLQGR